MLLPSTGEKIRPRDIFILLRKRGSLMNALSKAFTHAGIDHHCQDKSAFLEHLYVKDFLSFLFFLSCPYDNLNLAALLKSPLFGFNEKALQELRKDKTLPLWEALQYYSDHPLYKKSVDFLHYFIEFSKHHDLYTFIHTYLHTTYARFFEHFGAIIEPFIEHLLTLTQTSMQKSILTFEELAHFIQREAPLLKTANASHTSGVRIMTIHGSKGLQSPIVILPDTGDFEGGSFNNILFTNDFHALRQQNTLLEPLKNLEKKTQEQENHRLLYVALTRAQDYLFITGLDKGEKESWYSLLSPLMEKDESTDYHHYLEKHSDEHKTSSVNPSVRTEKAQHLALSAPSKSLKSTASASSEKGILLHKLFELLSLHSKSYLKTHPLFKDIQEKEVESIIHLYNNHIKPLTRTMQLFHELSIKDEEGKLHRLDCLAINATEAIIIDIKTGMKTPYTHIEHTQQIKRYAENLKSMYPNHTIKGLLLYTHLQEVVWITITDNNDWPHAIAS